MSINSVRVFVRSQSQGWHREYFIEFSLEDNALLSHYQTPRSLDQMFPGARIEKVYCDLPLGYVIDAHVVVP